MPSDWPEYELLDFGGGRKLERFAGLVVDRPAPQATTPPKGARSLWQQAHWRFAGTRMGEGAWQQAVDFSAAKITCPLTPELAMTLQVEASPAGQVGLFPEQFANWQWLARHAARAAEPLRMLNLFAYTGGSTLALAAAGAEVTHVDASRPAVAWARRNAELSNLTAAPIRWVMEDALRYVEREVKRGQRYDGVVLDPPSYGHGAKGEAWRLERDLPRLLALCGELVERSPRLMLLTAHTPGVGPAELSAYLSDGVIGHCGQPPQTGTMRLTAADNRNLTSGSLARWPV